MAGGGLKDILRGPLWAACLLAAGGAQAASESAGGSSGQGGGAALAAPASASAPVAAIAGAVMPAAYYGMTEAARGDSLLRAVMLDAHNGERASLGLTPLIWDDALAADAARYADDMARTGLFRHSARGTRAIPSGENLWMGPRRLYGYDVMVGSFLDEKRLTRMDGKLPNVSSTGRWQDVGHYTQMIWRGTKKVGCALGDGPQNEYLVCRYFPAGNAFGKGPLDADEDGAPAPAAPSAPTQVASLTP